MHELRENIGLKTLFNGCQSQHSSPLPNPTMRDLVQRNWSQSCLLPGFPLADLKRRSHLSSESKPTGLLRVGKEPHSGSPVSCSASFKSLSNKKNPFSFIFTFFSSKHSYAKQVCVCVWLRNMYPIAEHVVVQRPSRLQPDAFPGVFIRQKQTVV